MTGTGKVTIETLQRLVGAFNAHDIDAVMSFFTDDPVLELPRGPSNARRSYDAGPPGAGDSSIRSTHCARHAGASNGSA